MKPLLTKGIVLNRTDYGEADRIITVLTPDKGKLRLMVRGVRKVKSKMAGGIELFSVSELSYLKGKGEIDTLISARLDKHYGNIVRDMERVQLGYELIKIINKATEDQPETEYFDLLQTGFEALDNDSIDINLIRTWYQAQLLRLSGHTPNLTTDTARNKLEPDQKYSFDIDDMTFTLNEKGKFASDHIKFLRLVFSGNPPKLLAQVKDFQKLLPQIAPLTQTMLQTHIRI